MTPASGSAAAFQLRRWLGWILALALVSPFLILLFWTCLLPLGIRDFSSASHRLIWHEVAAVFLFTSAQALASALGALVLGIAGAYGLAAIPAFLEKFSTQSFARRHAPLASRVFETLALLPNLVPVLLLILAALKFLPGARGFWGIILLHVLLNQGLVSVAVVDLLRQRVGGLAELARVEGTTRTMFFWRAVLPILKSDLLSLGLFVFALSFSSFAIPLIIGARAA